MHDYLLSTEMVRFAFMLGVAVSMLLYEKRHLTTGSIVVPGYIATFILYPMIVAATFVNALVSYVLVNKLLRRWFLLYGRTKFTVLALISILIQTAMLKATPSGAWLWESDFKLFVGVGYVVPALIAHDMGRQGVVRTVKSVMYAATLVAIPIALALAFDVPGVNDLAPLEGFGDMAIDTAWLPFAVLLSAAAAWGVATNYGMRCGGFVGAAFIGMFMGDPWQVLVAGAIAAATYLIVTRLLMNHMILFGRRKFSSMLLVGSSLSWVLLVVGPRVLRPGSAAPPRSRLVGADAAVPPRSDRQRRPAHQPPQGGPGSRDGVDVRPHVDVVGAVAVRGPRVGARVEGGRRRPPSAPSSGVRSSPCADATPPTDAAAADIVDVVPAAVPRAASHRRRPIGVAAAFGMGGYRRWAAAHPVAAQAAERWLTAMVGDGTVGVPALALPAAGPIDTGWSPRRGLRPPQIEQLRTSALAARSGAAPLPSVPTYRMSPTYRGSEQDPLRVDDVLPG